MKYCFGPVNSRRFGISLGVDLLPYKTCSLNCVYCECGETTALTSARGEYVPTDDVITELDAYLSGAPRLDAVTFSGSGEPTLHVGIGRIINHVKTRFPRYKIVVLSNGTMFWDRDVRQSIAEADIVVPSLDAVSPGAFARICRPADDITPEKVVDGLIRFRKEFRGKIYLEIFIVPGVNDNKEELARLKEACLRINPDKIQINSLDRPGAEPWVGPAGMGELISVREFFTPLEAEIIGRPAAASFQDGGTANLERSVISILRRRPSTMDDLIVSTGAGRGDLQKTLSTMMERGLITVEKLDRGDFYRVV
jgi:wyosine [tRNA(Phe)-imidazoG37] synthetase (radical SAM superfamily)